MAAIVCGIKYINSPNSLFASFKPFKMFKSLTGLVQTSETI